MNFRWGIFYAVSILLAFVVGIASQHTSMPQKKLSAKARTLCVGNNACQHGPLSIFSKDLVAKAQAQQAPQKPGGFCLQVPILLYHHIQPQADAASKGQTSLSVDNSIFDQQMAYVASRGYTAISAQQLVSAIISHGAVPAKSIVLTFDDGYLDNYVYAYPTLQKYHLVGNLMIPTGLLGGNGGANVYYSWDQLSQMVGSGLMFAYDHTWSHYAMGAGPADKDTYEAKTGLQQLQQHLGSVYPLFVYPYGSGQTLSWVQKLLQNDGFVAAFSTLPGVYQCESNIMALPRLHIGNASLSSYGL